MAFHSWWHEANNVRINAEPLELLAATSACTSTLKPVRNSMVRSSVFPQIAAEVTAAEEVGVGVGIEVGAVAWTPEQLRHGARRACRPNRRRLQPGTCPPPRPPQLAAIQFLCQRNPGGKRLKRLLVKSTVRLVTGSAPVRMRASAAQ